MNNASQPNISGNIEEETIADLTSPEFATEPAANAQLDINGISINSLAPKILIEQKDLNRVQPYLDILKKTIDAPGITNIALTGNYGSGKSTIINTFQSMHSEYEYLRISLASFGNVSEEMAEAEAEVKSELDTPKIDASGKKVFRKPAKVKEASKGKKEELERLLEVSILQQVFYHVKPSAIPDSRFKRITNIKNWEILWIALSFVLWVSSVLVLFKFDYINRINPSTWNSELRFDWIALPFFAIFFAGIGLSAKNVVRLLNNSKINKVNIKGELELGDKLDKSVFNEHLEEILYFFERTAFNLVVIEDLDRFESTDIFTKLRELNTLLNNSLSIKDRKGHKEIVFLYAISDETFKDKNERVKFFEYIIPVIPFINPSNAGEQLGRLIKEAKINDARFKEFTEDLVTFIDDIDMRLLTNIFHEYQLYRENLSPILQQDKLFAMITYKNMFPEDFSKLHNRKGNLYDILSKRDSYVKALIKNIDEEIESNLVRIDNIESVHQNSIDELRAVYINALLIKIPDASALKIKKRISFSELMKEEHFNALTKLDKIEYYYYQVHSSYTGFTLDREHSTISNVSFSDLEEFVNAHFTYEERVQHIKDAGNGKNEELKSEIDKLKAKKLDIESWSLSEIFEQVNIEPYIEHFSDNGLIRNLLLNGYIDENYSDFISLFHEVNMSSEDFVFEKNVKSGTISAFDYKLTHIDYLVKKLHEKYFRREVILNLDLVAYLLSDEINFVDKRDWIFGLFSAEKTRSLIFIDDFISRRPEKAGKFIKLLSRSWANCWNYLEKKSGYPAYKLEKYLHLLVTNADTDDLVSQGGSLSVYISNKPNFLTLFASDIEQRQARKAIENLGVQFAVLDPVTTQTLLLFDFVYNNNHYQINPGNILLMLSTKAPGVSIEEAEKSNYTAIQQSGCEPLIKYVMGSINTYVKDVFLKLPENKCESEEKVLELLNNIILKDELKTAMMVGKYMMISDLSKVSRFDLQQDIMNNDCMEPNWNNVFVYYDRNLKEREEGDKDTSFDEILINYFNIQEHYKVLSKEGFDEDGSRQVEYIRSFAIKLMTCDQLHFDTYIALMEAHTYSYSASDFNHLCEDKVKWLVKNGRLRLNKHNFDHLKEHFEGQQIKLLENQQELLRENLEELVLDEADTLALLASAVLSSENKLLVYGKLKDYTVIGNADIARLSCLLLSTVEGPDLSFDVIESMFRHSRSVENRIKLLNKHFSSMSQAQIRQLIESLGGDYPEIFVKRHKPKFSNQLFHFELFNKLKEAQMILNFDIYEKDSSKLKVLAHY
eukprot:TRINITY_DN175_c0_g2_i1.p1 TRINITY_DN175_c0_g2~~TRINITY_DN175_c0_g2_i1.p1  ORF type:complete len:1290 (-),score=83.22 TRINITY_DN175_c0_g2_i1:1939-5808(-)